MHDGDDRQFAAAAADRRVSAAVLSLFFFDGRRRRGGRRLQHYKPCRANAFALLFSLFAASPGSSRSACVLRHAASSSGHDAFSARRRRKTLSRVLSTAQQRVRSLRQTGEQTGWNQVHNARRLCRNWKEKKTPSLSLSPPHARIRACAPIRGRNARTCGVSGTGGQFPTMGAAIIKAESCALSK